MGIDQAHEQSNRTVKVDGMDNESELLDWTRSVPYSKMVCQSINVCSLSYHEDTKSFEKEFPSRGIKMIEAFKQLEKPFF